MINYYIDPINGNDTNDGLTPATAFKTHAKLESIMPFGTLISDNTNVFIMNNLPSTDPINIRVSLVPNITLGYYGGMTTTIGNGASSILTGSLSNVVAINRSLNVPWQFTDVNVPSWSSYLGKRYRITSGLNAGNFGYIAKDLGSGAARVSAPAVISNVISGLGAFANGDSYVLEEPITCYIGEFVINTRWNGSSSPPAVFNMQDLKILNFETQFDGTASIEFKACHFAGIVAAVYTDNVDLFLNCSFDNGAAVSGGCLAQFDAGLMRANTLSFNMLNGAASLDGDFLVQGGSGVTVRGGTLQLSLCGIFDTVAYANFNPRGSGVLVGQSVGSGGPGNGKAFAFIHRRFHSPVAAYGAGNAGYGVDVLSGNVLAYDTSTPTGLPTLTGNLGDFILGQDTSNISAYDQVNHVYTAPIAPSWNNLNTPVSLGGFGKCAHNVARLASIVDYS